MLFDNILLTTTKYLLALREKKTTCEAKLCDKKLPLKKSLNENNGASYKGGISGYVTETATFHYVPASADN